VARGGARVPEADDGEGHGGREALDDARVHLERNRDEARGVAAEEERDGDEELREQEEQRRRRRVQHPFVPVRAPRQLAAHGPHTLRTHAMTIASAATR
jgi:hypothetical protein